MQSQINSSLELQVKLSSSIQNNLCCPICKGNLKLDSKNCQCINSECKALFPIENGIPILIDETNSIFAIDDFLQSRNTFFDLTQKNALFEKLKNFIPNISLNIKGKENYKKLANILLTYSHRPKLLIIGGSILGEGTEAIVNHPDIELVETDISFGPRTSLICDAHSLPFIDNSFDGVIVQAVLEHVLDPYKCVEEIHRVLKDDGIVYAETPFMQQVHGGCYDFTRFTYLGHRRLFRKFEEIESGAVCGPGMALAWSYKYLFLSFIKSKFLKRLVELFVRLTAFPLKYLDYVLIDRGGTLDAASGYYFIGKKSWEILPDKELIKLYKGSSY
jgi:SAM-dependent methyltransferase